MRRGTDIDHAAAVLSGGGLVAFPTETVYGLGADASRDDAVARIFAAKGRPVGHPLIVHLADGAALDDGWASGVSAPARALAARFWPGPLTLILARGARVAAATTGGADTVGVRVPAHPMARQLLARFGGGVAAPSANRFGALSPTTAAHVVADLGAAVDYVLDGGPCTVGVESTIVDCSGAAPTLLRPGGVAVEAIAALLAELGAPALAAPGADAPRAPGTLPSHYAPRTPVIAVTAAELADAVWALPAGARVAVLATGAVLAATPDLPVGLIYGPLPEDPAAAARTLYATLRDLDGAGVDVIVAALPDPAGLGLAIADRLRRAAAPRPVPALEDEST